MTDVVRKELVKKLELDTNPHRGDASIRHVLIQELCGAAKIFLANSTKQEHELGSPQIEIDDDARNACILFIARTLASRENFGIGANRPSNKNHSLTNIVAACSTNLYDFFRELPVTAAKLAPFLEAHGAKWQALEVQHHVKEYQRMLISLTLLSKKFKELVPRYIHNMGVLRPSVLRLGWLLFLVLKVKLLPAFPDLVSCINLLGCVLNILVAHAPEGILSANPRQPGAPPLDSLKSICTTLKADPSSVADQMAAADSLLRHLLPNFISEWRAEDRLNPARESVSCNCGYYSGLLSDPTRTRLASEGLEREFKLVSDKQGTEVDELEFLFKDFSTLASPRFPQASFLDAATKIVRGHGAAASAAAAVAASAQAGSAARPPKGFKMLGPGALVIKKPPGGGPGVLAMVAGVAGAAATPLGLQSPMPMGRLAAAGGPASTPLTETMAAASWLRSALAGLAPEPSERLKQYFEDAGRELVASSVTKRALEMVEAGMPDDRPSGPASSSLMGFPHVQSSLSTLRRVETLKLYYAALEAVLAGECATGACALPVLLNAAKFHRGLMACCLEVVIASYKMASCSFPLVLDRLKLKAFDLSKVIQSFVKHLPSLPRELKRHLFHIEERVLEALAWEPGSPLYMLIIQSSAPPPAAAGPSRLLAPSAGCDAGAALAAASASPVGMMEGVIAATVCDLFLCDQQDGDAAARSSGVVPGPPPSPRRSDVGLPPSPKRSQSGPTAESVLSGLMSPSPLKKSRCCSSDGSGLLSVPRLLFAEPLPLSVGRGPPATPEAGTTLDEFLAKVLKLMSFRLALVSDSFDFFPLDHAIVFSSVRTVLEHALYRHTHLLYNRHCDQLVLSALYGFCKVHKLDKVSFREIINQYKRQPQATQSVFRSVNLEQANPSLLPRAQGDIINFYNQIFVPVMKPFLVKLSVTGEPAGNGPGGGSSQHPLGLPPMPPPPPPPRQQQQPAVSLGIPPAAAPASSLLGGQQPPRVWRVPTPLGGPGPSRLGSQQVLPQGHSGGAMPSGLAALLHALDAQGAHADGAAAAASLECSGVHAEQENHQPVASGKHGRQVAADDDSPLSYTSAFSAVRVPGGPRLLLSSVAAGRPAPPLAEPAGLADDQPPRSSGLRRGEEEEEDRQSNGTVSDQSCDRRLGIAMM